MGEYERKAEARLGFTATVVWMLAFLLLYFLYMVLPADEREVEERLALSRFAVPCLFFVVVLAGLVGLAYLG